jgi:hypothetical protein
LISFLPTPGDGAIGALDYSSKERKRLAKESISYCCKQCGPIINLLPKLDPDNDEKKKSATGIATKEKSSSSSFAKEIEELKRLQLEREGQRGGNNNSNSNSNNNNNKKKEDDGDDSKKCVEKDDQQQHQKEDSITSEEAAAKVEEKGEVKQTPSSSEDTKEASVTEEESNFATTTDDAAAAAVGEVEVELEQSNSWMYDPLLNVSIVFFGLICALFIKKAFDLSVELQELKDLPSLSPIDVKEAVTTAADAVASSLASAASSGGGEEL